MQSPATVVISTISQSKRIPPRLRLSTNAFPTRQFGVWFVVVDLTTVALFFFHLLLYSQQSFARRLAHLFRYLAHRLETLI